VSADFFLWGGFFSLLWRGFSWMGIQESFSAEITDVTLGIINVGLSDVALCCFGYLAFGKI